MEKLTNNQLITIVTGLHSGSLLWNNAHDELVKRIKETSPLGDCRTSSEKIDSIIDIPAIKKEVDIAMSLAQLLSDMARPIPKYPKGSPSHPGGAAIVGETGPEKIMLPRRWSDEDMMNFALWRRSTPLSSTSDAFEIWKKI